MQLLHEAADRGLGAAVVRHQHRHVLRRVLQHATKALGKNVEGAVDRDADPDIPARESQVGPGHRHFEAHVKHLNAQPGSARRQPINGTCREPRRSFQVPR